VHLASNKGASTTHLDHLRALEAIELVQQLEHGALHLGVSAARAALAARRANRVNLIHEDDRRRVLARHDEQLAHHAEQCKERPSAAEQA
jgi:hypothetical protein